MTIQKDRITNPLMDEIRKSTPWWLKYYIDMKDFIHSWKFWVAIAAVVLAIVAVVLWFTCRPFCYATSGFLIGAFAGFIGGYYVGKKYGCAN